MSEKIEEPAIFTDYFELLHYLTYEIIGHIHFFSEKIISEIYSAVNSK